MNWIRFIENNDRVSVTRYHAVLKAGEKDGVGGYWTYCGRFQRYGGVRDTTVAPHARCACCRGRILHPYLIEPKLNQLAARASS